MKLIPIFLLFCIYSSNSLAQLNVKNDSIQISVSLTKMNVSQNSDLCLKFQVKNLTKRKLLVYENWEEGAYGDKMANCNIEITVLENGKYIPFYKRYKHHIDSIYTSEIYRHYDLPMIDLPNGSSKDFNFNILTLTETFPPGEYKLRIHFRVKTIPNLNNFSQQDYDLGLLQPFDTIKYLSTKWLSFKVSKFISL